MDDNCSDDERGRNRPPSELQVSRLLRDRYWYGRNRKFDKKRSSAPLYGRRDSSLVAAEPLQAPETQGLALDTARKIQFSCCNISGCFGRERGSQDRRMVQQSL